MSHLPKPVREALHIGPKDHIIYEILNDNTVIIRRVTLMEIEY